MTFGHGVAIFAAGIAAGTVNTVVGSGTLITFPVLLGFGYAPVTANVSNTAGQIPGAAAGAYGYRRELRGQRGRAVELAVSSMLGGVVGAVLLLVLPASAFRAIVPVFIGISLVAIVVQPRISRALARTRGDGRPPRRHLLLPAVFATGVYGGYFGAAQSILLLAILAIAIAEDLQRLNAVKIVLTGLVNLVAAVIFIAAGRVDWAPAVLIAAGSVLGGAVGASVGRRLPPPVLRAAIVVVGVVAIVQLVR